MPTVLFTVPFSSSLCRPPAPVRRPGLSDPPGLTGPRGLAGPAAVGEGPPGGRGGVGGRRPPPPQPGPAAELGRTSLGPSPGTGSAVLYPAPPRRSRRTDRPVWGTFPTCLREEARWKRAPRTGRVASPYH